VRTGLCCSSATETTSLSPPPHPTLLRGGHHQLRRYFPRVLPDCISTILDHGAAVTPRILGKDFFSSLILTKFRCYSLFSSCFAPSSHFQSSITTGVRLACKQKPKLTWVLHHAEAYFFCLMLYLIARPSRLVSDFDSQMDSGQWSCVLWASAPARDPAQPDPARCARAPLAPHPPPPSISLI
jgi:hypothetical protein